MIVNAIVTIFSGKKYAEFQQANSVRFVQDLFSFVQLS